MLMGCFAALLLGIPIIQAAPLAAHWRLMCFAHMEPASSWDITVLFSQHNTCESSLRDEITIVKVSGTADDTAIAGIGVCDVLSVASLKDSVADARVFKHTIHEQVLVGTYIRQVGWRWCDDSRDHLFKHSMSFSHELTFDRKEWMFTDARTNGSKYEYCGPQPSYSGPFGICTTQHGGVLSITCLKYAYARENHFEWEPVGISWRSPRSSYFQNEARIAFRTKPGSPVNCVRFVQWHDSICPLVRLQSSSDGSTWWDEAGALVQTQHTADADEFFIIDKSQYDVPCTRLDRFCKLVYYLPTASASLAMAWLRFAGNLILYGSPFFALVIISMFLVGFECWAEVRELPPKFRFRSLGEPQTPLRVFKINLVCHPCWMLRVEALAQLISRMCPQLQVLPSAEALVLFPSGIFHRKTIVEAFEAVVRTSENGEEVGRMLQILLERSRAEHGGAKWGSHVPRVQLSASIRGTFLHFGGSLGCGRRRWRSCPARLSESANTYSRD